MKILYHGGSVTIIGRHLSRVSWISQLTFLGFLGRLVAFFFRPATKDNPEPEYVVPQLCVDPMLPQFAS